MHKLSSLAKNLKSSSTVAIAAKVRDMKAKGIDIISLSIGQPDFDTPGYIKEAAIKAIKDGFTKYTPASGIKELREAVCDKFERDNNLKFAPDQVIMTTGAKHAISLSIQALCGSGDEVIIPSPYWVSYPEQVKLAGAKPVIIPGLEKDGFKISKESLSSAITPKTKLLILNSPSNPAGVVYEKDELESMAEVILSKGIFVISDEIYEKIIYGTSHVSIAGLGADIKEKTIVVNGVSKTYAMTGWRVGYAAGDKEIISAMIKLQSQMTSHPSSIAQKASLAAIEGAEDSVVKMKKEFEKRRDYILERVNELKFFSCVKPGGAFYIFPGITSMIGKTVSGITVNGSKDFADLLLDKARVAVVPGVDFGSDFHIRISYAASIEKIKEGIDRIRNVMR